MQIAAYSRITGNSVFMNGNPVSVERTDKDWLTDIYNQIGMHYPKFFKMDALCKAGVLGAELVMPALASEPDAETGLIYDTAVLLFNRSASLQNDTAYCSTIRPDNYFPSPALFVYTLPNILTGEIAIRHRLAGETACYIDERFDAGVLCRAVNDCFADTQVLKVLVGWAEYFETVCDVLMVAVHRGPKGLMTCNEDNLNYCYSIK